MKHAPTLQIVLLLLEAVLTHPVHAICTIDSLSNGNFGTVTTQNNILNQHLADITVSCDTGYLLAIDAGGAYSGGSRQLNQSGHTIPYTLFQAATSNEWGNNNLAIPTNTYPQPALSASGNNTHTIYASAFTKDKVPQGHYSDTVTVILADVAGVVIETKIFNFNLDLVAFCTLDASNFHSFGNYGLGSARVSGVALGSIVVSCPASIDYKIGLNAGLHLSGGMRRMSLNDTAFIPYVLRYNNSAEWGDTGLTAMDSNYVQTFPALAVAAQGTGVTQSFAIYGDAWIENATTMGTYTDTVTVTLIW